MESNAKLFLLYIDALRDGAEMGDLIAQLYEWNALHVQVMTTVTRQNQTGYTVLVEVDAGDEWRLAKGLAEAYGIARYHRLETVLQYQPVARNTRPIVATHHEKQLGLTVGFDLIGTEREPLYVRVRDEDIETLRRRVAEEFGLDLAGHTLRERLEALLMREDGFVLDLAE
jgi:hypothetical protein